MSMQPIASFPPPRTLVSLIHLSYYSSILLHRHLFRQLEANAMDPFAIIGVVASTAQLAAYASSACQVVYRLLRQIPQCPNEHKMAAQHLLQVLKQVADLPSVSRDFENFISQLLIEITTLVHRFSTELENQSSLSRFLYHAVTHRAVLSETFRTLVTKREELSLQLLSYISLRMSENNNMGCGQSKALRHGDPSSAATGSQDVSTSQACEIVTNGPVNGD